MHQPSRREKKPVAAAVLAAALVGALLLGVRGASGAGTTCVVAPELRDATIGQGLPYTELTPGKDVLVRLFLRKPKCADNVEMELTGASITVSGGSQPHTVTAPVPALQTGDGVYPIIAPYGTAADDHPGDPVLVVPGAAVGRSDGAAFELAVTSTITFRWRPGSNDPWTTGVTAPTGELVSGAPTAAAVGPASRPLRVLVVPMGDLAAGTASQFPASATEAVENGMQTLHRLLPVPSGVADLLALTGGIRYRIAPGMINLGPTGLNLMAVDGDGVRRFCGTEGNFPNIARLLSAYLVAWNTANPAFAADRAIGAVWEGISKGSPCAEGVGSYATREGWVRAIPDRPATATAPAVPSKTGALLGMEIQHTFGGVADGAPNDNGSGHSVNFDADGGTQRAYHTTDAAYLAGDLTVMRYASLGWNNTNVLMEQPDWAQARCVLTPPPPGSTDPCPSGGLVGAPIAARGSSLVVSGVTDGTAAGTDAHSFASDDVQRTPPVEHSRHALVQFDEAGTEVQRDEFAVGARHSDHSHDGNDSIDTELVEFDVAVARHATSFRFQLRHDDTVLYERRTGDVPEYVGAAPPVPVGGPLRITDGPADEVGPALSGDGSLLAWHDPTGVRLRLRSGTTVSEPVAGGREPALSADGSRLAYVLDGDLWVATVTVADGVPVVSGHRRVYDRRIQTLGDPRASHPSFDSGALVAVAIDGDLWSIDTDFQPSLSNPLLCQLGALLTAPCRPLTATAAVESRPAWGDGPLVAYERDGDVWTLDASSSPGTTETRRVVDAVDPALGGDILAFGRGDAVLAVDSSRFDAATTLVESAGAPAVSGDGRTLAYDRLTDGQRDVYLQALSAEGDTFVVRHPRPTELRADLWAVTGDVADPMAVAVKPSSVSGDLATFHIPYDPAAAPPGSTRRIQVSDGWSTTIEEFGPPATGSRPPVAAVYAPSVGAEILQYDPIPLAGSAKDAGGDELTGSALRWSHRPPGQIEREVGTGARVDGPGIRTPGFLDPPVGGWPVGAHEVALRATDADGRTSQRSVTFQILPDEDRDGRPAPTDVACPGAATGGDDDPYDAFLDDDRDGIINGADDHPCTADVDVTTDFDPDSLYVPSAGTQVTVYFSGSDALAGIDVASVRVVQLGHHRLEVPLAAESWTHDRRTGRATAKFDRSAMTTAMHQLDLTGGWVPVVFTGRSPTFQFRGADPAAPIAFPAS